MLGAASLAIGLALLVAHTEIVLVVDGFNVLGDASVTAMETDVNAVSGPAGTDYGDQYFFTNPRIETGDPRYAWVNTTFFVGEGRFLPGLGVEYRVWRPA